MHPLYLSETHSECGDNCTKFKITSIHVVNFLIRVPWGPFGAVFQNIQNSDMYVYLVVFYGAELKNQCCYTQNFTVGPSSVGSGGLRAKRAQALNHASMIHPLEHSFNKGWEG